MSEWRKTKCDLCPTSCGLEVLVEDNRIIKSRGDKDNLYSRGYICRKGLNIQYHQHSQRLTHPLKKVGDRYEKISWDQALAEISGKLKTIVGKNSPKSVAYAGEPPAWGGLLMGALGSQNYYSSLAQELSGDIFVHGPMMGNPALGLAATPDYDQTDMLLIIGWNPMQSNMMPQAAKYLPAFSKDPSKILVVIDPRRSETAKLAHIHLPIRPGTDALLVRAMIAIILKEGWHNPGYIAQHAANLDKVLSLFADFDIRAAIQVCQLEYDQVREVCRLFATRKSSLHSHLGIEMSRHSTATSYLEVILQTVCGRLGVAGGNVIHGSILHSDAPAPKPGTPLYRTPATGYFPIMGMLPPNIIPEEILSDKPDRLRAVIVCAANPLRSWADTRAFEKAFKHLELLVTIEMAMTETAAVSDYVLPAQSCFESWGGVLPCASATFPGIFFQFRQPVLKSEGEALETFEILVRLADRLGLIPPIPDSLVQSAHGDRLKFAAELTAFVKSDPALAAALPFILAKTLGKAMNSIKLAELWFNLYTAPEHIVNSLAQAGFKPGPGQVEEIFSAIVAHPEGIWAGSNNLQFNLMSLGTPDKRINLFIPEMFEWVKQIDAESESKALQIDQRYPLILSAGIHNDIVANTQLRDPAWNKGHRVCTLAMNPADAGLLKLTDGQKVQISTEVGSAEIELEVTDSVRTGQVIIPHGFGLDFNGVTQGVNINLLTRNTRRDPIAGTPWHRYVPCRVEGL